MKTVAYMHKSHDGCVTSDSTAYDSARELVLRSEAEAMVAVAQMQTHTSQQHCIEAIAQRNDWMTYAKEAGAQKVRMELLLKEVAQQRNDLIRAAHAALPVMRKHAEQGTLRSFELSALELIVQFTEAFADEGEAP